MRKRTTAEVEPTTIAALEKRREILHLKLAEAELNAAEKLFEADSIWSRYVAPQGPFVNDSDGSWQMVETDDEESLIQGFANEQQLTRERSRSRLLCLSNGFAINAIENRISYSVGTGIKIKATAKSAGPGPAPESVQKIVQRVQDVIDYTFKINDGFKRQQEAMRRYDRDGEVFRRLFVMPDNSLRVRFVEPAAISETHAKDSRAYFRDFSNPKARMYTWGILTDGNDAETPLAYLTKKEAIPADEIIHSKANVDLSTKRGVPTFFPIGESLTWAYEVVKRASKLTAIQSSIAIIRKLNKTTQAQAGTFLAAQTAGLPSRTSMLTGQDVRQIPVREGSMIDVSENVDLEFPAAKINAANFSVVVQMILRLSASRFTMPEWMFTSDASNANYSSTMVAEGPATKGFQRLQIEMGEPEKEIARRAVELKAGSNGIPEGWEEIIELNIIPPRVEAQNNLEEAQVDQIDMTNQVLSPQTRAQRRGLNYEAEQDNIDEFLKKKNKRLAAQPLIGPQPPAAQPRNPKPTVG